MQVQQFQRDFGWAISSWIEMGISQKMEADTKALPYYRGMFDEKAWWTLTNVIGKKTLTIFHVLPSFLFLAFGLFFSVIVFVLEVMLSTRNQTTIAKPTLQNNSCKGVGESDKPAIAIFTQEGTMEPNEKINPKLKMEKAKDSDDKMMKLPEIQEELCKEESKMENVQNEPFTASVTSIISLDDMEIDRIGPCETVLKKVNTNIIGDNTQPNYNLSGEWSPTRNSPQWSEIIDFLDNEESTIGLFLDEDTLTTQTLAISPELDIPNNIDSRRASSKGSAVSEEDRTESILAMVEIHETPDQGISG